MLAIRNAKMGRPLSEEELQDVAQDAFVVALRRLRDYQPFAPLESWLHGICSLLLKDAVRNQARGRERGGLDDEATALAEPGPSRSVLDGAEIEGLLDDARRLRGPRAAAQASSLSRCWRG